MSGESLYVDLHVHTQYSIRDGIGKISDLVEKTKSMGRSALAITDHGNLSGTIEFYNECQRQGIKAILGCEVYVAATSRFDKSNSKDNVNYHLVLLARNNEGYKNLCQLSTLSYTEGFYNKPRIDIELLKKYREGIIALSSCSCGEVIAKLLSEEYDSVKKAAQKYRDIFGSDFYLEVQRHGTLSEDRVIDALKKISKELDIKLIATNDVHYVNKEDAYAQNVMLKMRDGVQNRNADKYVSGNGEHYIKDDYEMTKLFADIPEALANSVKVADECNVSLNFNQYKLPVFDSEDKSSEELLRELAEEGLKQRYDTITNEIRQRFEYEFEVISKRGFADYFLIVQEYVKYAKDLGYLVGPGRGSAVGSIIAYALDITAVDPLKYDLFFERFLNPGRETLPDIDVDFEPEAREKIIEHLKAVYGQDKVCRVATFAMLRARQITRDLTKCLKIDEKTTEKILDALDDKVSYFKELFETEDREFLNLYEHDEKVKRITDLALKLEGNTRQISTHASAVIISDKAVYNYVPLAKRDDTIITQFTFEDCEKLGLLKLDLLSLNYLTVIRKTIEFAGIDKDIGNISLDDKNVFDFIAAGNTFGIFQLEGEGMSEAIEQMKPSNLKELAAGISLYRPGPMEMIETYINNKKTQSEIKYQHPALKPILEETCGCIIYQEQVMQICTALAGYTLVEADTFRQIIKKKNTKEAEDERARFVSGCLENGIEKATAENIFEKIVKFAKYAFNKSHAVSYAIITYITAYLKYYYTASFMAALMEIRFGNTEKFEKCISESRKFNIKINCPDINRSQVKFSASKNEIFFGLSDISAIGEELAEKIIKERENGEFKSLSDFINRLSDVITMNKLKNLIKAGAFDFCGTRLKHLAVYEKMLKNAKNDKINEENGEETNCEREFSDDVIKFFEKQLLKFSVSKMGRDSEKDVFTTAELCNSKTMNRKYVHLDGTIKNIKHKLDRYQNRMCFFELEDDFGEIRVTVFSSKFNDFRKNIKAGNKISLYGYLSVSKVFRNSIQADSLRIYRDRSVDDDYGVYIKVSDFSEKTIDQVRRVIFEYMGYSKVRLTTDKKNQRVVMDDEILICKNSIDCLCDIFGEENVVVYKNKAKKSIA